MVPKTLSTAFLGGGGVEGKRDEDLVKVHVTEIFLARDGPVQSSPVAPSPMASSPHSSQEPSHELPRAELGECSCRGSVKTSKHARGRINMSST